MFILNVVIDSEFFNVSVDVIKVGVIGYLMGGFGVVSIVGGCYVFNDEVVVIFMGIKDLVVIVLVK